MIQMESWDLPVLFRQVQLCWRGKGGQFCLEAASWDYIVVCHVVYMRHRHPGPNPSAHLAKPRTLW